VVNISEKQVREDKQFLVFLLIVMFIGIACFGLAPFVRYDKLELIGLGLFFIGFSILSILMTEGEKRDVFKGKK
jgi:uncharacterized membrane protein